MKSMKKLGSLMTDVKIDTKDMLDNLKDMFNDDDEKWKKD